MTDELLTHFKQDIDEMVLIPSDGGKFELFVDDHQVHSKLDTGAFPEVRTVIKAMESLQKS